MAGIPTYCLICPPYSNTHALNMIGYSKASQQHLFCSLVFILPCQGWTEEWLIVSEKTSVSLHQIRLWHKSSCKDWCKPGLSSPAVALCSRKQSENRFLLFFFNFLSLYFSLQETAGLSSPVFLELKCENCYKINWVFIYFFSRFSRCVFFSLTKVCLRHGSRVFVAQHLNLA